MGASLSNLAASFLVMLMFIYLVALCMIQGLLIEIEVGGLQLADSTADPSFWEYGEDDHPAMQISRLYGSVPKTMLTLFMAISGGMDWKDAARPVSRLNAFFVVVWTIYVLFMVVGLLNVLVGIFVDGAMQSVRLDRDQVIRDEVEMTQNIVGRFTNIFKAADTNNDGVIDKEEWESLLCQSQTVTQLKALGIDAIHARTLFKLLDADGSGSVDADEFVAGCLRLMGNARSTDMVALLYQSEKSHRKLNEIFKEMRKFTDGMNSMSSMPCKSKASKVDRKPQGPVVSTSHQNCSKIFSQPADCNAPWIQPWMPRIALDL